MIDTSAAPYFDDFQENKNYLKVLFKPGYAVQSRELNQLQTSLQNQISKMGDHVFKDGSIVLGGFSNYYDASYIDLEGVGDINDLLDTVITGSSVGGSGARAKVAFVLPINNVYRVYIGIIGKNRFVAGETVTTINMAQFTVVNSAYFSGTARLFSIDESVFYTKGHYVYCEKQIIEVNSLNARVGLVISETIVDSYNDYTLLDPAQGSYNYAAPGADRYHISLTLTAFDLVVETVDDLKFGNFIELAQISNSHLVNRISKASYSDLEVNLARRTYDESGDYTVRPFGIKINPDINGDSSKLTVSVDPGKAYIKGYEFETLGITNISINKAREVSDVVDTVIGLNFGTFLYIEPFSGVVDYESHPIINFYGAVDGTGVSIGTANIDSISYYATGPILKLSLINVQLNTASTFEDVKSIKSGSAIANISLVSYPDNVVNIKTNIDKPFILKTPHEYIKTLLTKPASPNYISDTEIICYKKLTATISNDVATLTLSGNESFINSNLNDFLTVTSTGTIVFPTNITSVGNTIKNLTYNGVIGNISVYVKIAISETQHRTKGLVITGLVENVVIRDAANVLSRDKISLNTADCYTLDKIIAKSSKVDSGVIPLDVTQYFIFNNGQKDDLYDFGWVQIRSGFDIPAAYDMLNISFSYFEHMTYNGFFSVDSYSDIAYENIPSYVSSKGVVYNLHSCLDFRPIRVSDGTIENSYGIVLDSNVSVEYTYYLARIDKLVLTKERKLTVIKGIPAVSPKEPSDLIDAMSLYTIYIPPYTVSHKDVNFVYNDNRRFTMRDIGKIEKRVGRLEYYTTLSYLEKQANDETIASELPGINRFKNGILVDSFAGHSVGNPGNPDYKCSIDKLNRTLRPRFSSYSYLYDVNTLTTELTKENDLVHLDYSKSLLIENPYATKIVNANPYLIFNWDGMVTLNPATDNWVETKIRPDVIVNMNGENDVYTILNQDSDNNNSSGVMWNDWQSVIKGAVTGIEDEYDINNNSSMVTDRSTGGQTVTNSSKITNTRTTTTTDVDIQTGIEIMKSATRVLTKDIGNKVVDSSLVPFVRSRIVDFSAKHLKPETELYALLDGIDITQYTTPAIKITVTLPNNIPNLNNLKKITCGNASAIVISSNHNDVFIKYEPTSTSLFQIGDTLEGWIENTTTLGIDWTSVDVVGVIEMMYFYDKITTDDKGNVAGYFVIPDPNMENNPKFRTGELMFRLSDSLSVDCYTAAEVKYITQGLSQSTERTLIATRVASATVKPVTNIIKSDTINRESIVVGDVVSTVVLPAPRLPPTLACGDTIFGDGRSGVWEYFIDYGIEHPAVGETPQFVGIKINNSNGVPVKYTLIFEGHEYTTGFVGFDDNKPIGTKTGSIIRSETVDLFVTGNDLVSEHQDSLSYNDRLINNGLTPIVANSADRLQFLKTTKTAKALLKIEAPFEGADWGIESTCFPLPTPIPSYAISPDVLVVSEGDKVIFTVVTTNVDVGTILYWGLDTDNPITTAESNDFETSAGTITVNAAGVSIFSMNVVDDLDTENLERFSVVLRTAVGGDAVAWSSTITILDTSVTPVPTYSITPEAQFVVEGQRILFTVTTTHVSNNTTLKWEVDEPYSTSSTDDFAYSDGEIIVNNGVAVFSMLVVADLESDGNEYFRVNLSTYEDVLVDVSAAITIVDSTEDPTYSITPNVKKVAEGQTIDFYVVTTNVAGGTTLYWDIDGSAVADDFSPAVDQGSFDVSPIGTYTLSLVTLLDELNDELTENVSVNLYTDSGRTTKVATSTFVDIANINNTVVPTYSIVPLVPPGLKVNEGAAIPYIVSTTNVPNGTVLYWRIFNGTTDESPALPNNTVEPIDFEYGITGCYGSVTINNGNSGFGLQTINDEEGEDPNEGNEIVTVYLYTDAAYTNLVARAATVTIVDPIFIPKVYTANANLTDIGDKNLGFAFFAIIWGALTREGDWEDTISESKFITTTQASWSGWINGVLIKPTVKYKLIDVKVTERNVVGGYSPISSDSRILIDTSPINSQKVYHHIDKMWGGTILVYDVRYPKPTSITPINERALVPDDWGSPIRANGELLRPPNKLSLPQISSLNIIKSVNEPITLYVLFNPHIEMSSRKLSTNPLHFNVETTWQYVSGDDTIPEAYRILKINKNGSVTGHYNELRYCDPLAQSFFVDANLYPNGVFIKNVEVFFKKKSTWAPIEVQIRTVVNGYPSSQEILPFGIATKMANEVNVSTDATVGTNFEFDNIIHLSPGEHAFVVVTNSDEYELYVSRLGEFSINDPDERITTQPLLGSLFMSQNATTWTAIQEEDIKFRIFKCDFITNEVGTALLDTHYPNAGNIDYEVFYSGGETVDFSDTTIEYAVKPTAIVNGSAIANPTFIPYQVSTNVNMGETKTLVSEDGTSLQLQVQMSTADSNVTPIIDMNRLSNVLVKNIINNDAEGETQDFGGNAYAKYITRAVKLNPGFESKDLKLYFNAKVPLAATVKVYYKIATPYDNIIDDNTYTEMVLAGSDTWIDGQYIEYSYKTPFTDAQIVSPVGVVSNLVEIDEVNHITTGLITNMTSTAILDVGKAIFATPGTVGDLGVGVEYQCVVTKIINDTSIEFSLTGAGGAVAGDILDIRLGASLVGTASRAFANGEAFDTFYVKIVMLSSNPAFIPIIKDLRVIALDD